MPHHSWFESIKIGNLNSRVRDRERKNTKGNRSRGPSPRPKLASYQAIDKNSYMKSQLGDRRLQYYRLNDIAVIFGMSGSTIRRWFKAGMLPDFWTPNLYLKEQVFIISWVLNDLFSQELKQFRRSYSRHVQMMHDGDKMVRRRLSVKLARHFSEPWIN